jgi:hypothetical protein
LRVHRVHLHRVNVRDTHVKKDDKRSCSTVNWRDEESRRTALAPWVCEWAVLM